MIVKIKEMLTFLTASIYDANKYLTYEDAMSYITSIVLYTPINMDASQGNKKKRAYAEDIINNDIFPHCRTTMQKKYFLGYMTKQLILCKFGMIKPTDRDSYVNKTY